MTGNDASVHAGTVSAIPPEAKTSVLVESLPYIRRFWGKVVVVKYGGNVLQAKDGEEAIDEAAALASFAEDIVLMRSVGMLPVVVHGAAPRSARSWPGWGRKPSSRTALGLPTLTPSTWSAWCWWAR